MGLAKLGIVTQNSVIRLDTYDARLEHFTIEHRNDRGNNGKVMLTVQGNFNYLHGTFVQMFLWSHVFSKTKRVAGWRLSRFDIAADLLNTDLGRYTLRPKTPVKVVRYTGTDGKTETFEVGARGSDRRARIYDKKRQINSRDIAPDPGAPDLGQVDTWVRIEVQLQKQYIADWQHAFENFELVSFEGLTSLTTVPEQALVYYLYHEPHKWGELSKKEKMRAKRLFETAAHSDGNSLIPLIEQEIARVSDELEREFSTTFYITDTDRMNYMFRRTDKDPEKFSINELYGNRGNY
jgi:hypothetical protein